MQLRTYIHTHFCCKIVYALFSAVVIVANVVTSYFLRPQQNIHHSEIWKLCSYTYLHCIICVHIHIYVYNL